jgi:hypothetical protein
MAIDAIVAAVNTLLVPAYNGDGVVDTKLCDVVQDDVPKKQVQILAKRTVSSNRIALFGR